MAMRKRQNPHQQDIGTMGKVSKGDNREMENWLLAAIDSAPYGVLVHDKEGQILIFNAQLETICGYRKDEIPDIRTWMDIDSGLRMYVLQHHPRY